ncbi:MAG: hypothetical protein J7K73_00805, partial [Nanoarchaeota archaeon]|nr:hypothetical protein [Nanoarchaeota archaeon]
IISKYIHLKNISWFSLLQLMFISLNIYAARKAEKALVIWQGYYFVISILLIFAKYIVLPVAPGILFIIATLANTIATSKQIINNNDKWRMISNITNIVALLSLTLIWLWIKWM